MYAYKKEVGLGYEKAVEKAKTELKMEGFGILTEIDVKQTLKRKIGADFDDYVILGACNPSLAHKALGEERDVGVMLPCNLIVYRQNKKTFVSAVLPTVQLGNVGNPKLLPIARQVEARLKRVVDAV